MNQLIICTRQAFLCCTVSRIGVQPLRGRVGLLGIRQFGGRGLSESEWNRFTDKCVLELALGFWEVSVWGTTMSWFHAAGYACSCSFSLYRAFLAARSFA